MSIDIIVAPQSAFNAILQDVNNITTLNVTCGADVSIDDVVTIIALYRNVIDDRSAWWKLRREVNACFLTHPLVATRSLALIPDLYRDEIATFTSTDITSVATRWLDHEGSSPQCLEQATVSLNALVNACQRARDEGNGVHLRTNQPPNAFEVAFRKLSGKSLSNYARVFEKLDDGQKYEAHQKFNYYEKQGLENSLALVLRDLTRRSTKKVNLKTDQRAIQRHITKCVKEYCKAPRPISGKPDAPISLIMLTFDIEYEGYIDFGFDTRANAITDIQWEERTEGCFELAHWNEAVLRLGADELPLSVVVHDGSKIVISPDTDEDVFEACIGNMLRDTLVEARNAGVFSKLLLANPCYMLVGGVHANYAWPSDLIFGRECVANL